MKKIILIPVAALAACMAPEADRNLELSAEEEARLTEDLRGRVAGEPVSCVPMREVGGNHSIGQRAIVFKERIGDRIWVNRPAGGCPSLNFGRALRVRTTMTQLCSGDIVTVFDPATGMEYGGCGLGEFTPYRRVD